MCPHPDALWNRSYISSVLIFLNIWRAQADALWNHQATAQWQGLLCSVEGRDSFAQHQYTDALKESAGYNPAAMAAMPHGMTHAGMFNPQQQMYAGMAPGMPSQVLPYVS